MSSKTEHLAAAKAAARAKWPKEVKNVTMNRGGPVFEGYRQLVVDGKRFRLSWRSRKGLGFWATTTNHPVFFGKTLTEASIALAEALRAS